MKISGVLLFLMFVSMSSTIVPYGYCTSSASTSNLQIVSVEFPSSVPYNVSASVKIVVGHHPKDLPSVTVYYTYTLNGSPFAEGWRIALTRASWILRSEATVFESFIPNPNYGEQIPFGCEVIFYVEVADSSGNTILTCRESDRWDPSIRDDKYSFNIVDPYPPRIEHVDRSPFNVTSSDVVVIVAEAADSYSGVQSVFLNCTIQGLGREIREMVPTNRTGSYSTYIPSQAAGVNVTYQVEVRDRAGNLALSPMFSYVVSQSAERAQQARILLTALAALAVLLVSIGVALMIKRSAPSKEEGSICRHPQAFNGSLVVLAAVISLIYQRAFSEGHIFLATGLALTTAIIWTIVDPRTSIIPKRVGVFNDNPPFTLIAESYSIILLGMLAILGLHQIGLIDWMQLLSLGRIVLEYGLVLLVLGICLSTAWPYLKNAKITIEVES